MGYQILISEEQRVCLRRALEVAGVGANEGLAGFESLDPLAYWQGMLDDLPKMEAETPNALHGFCL